jgi:hypothetical protein
MQRLYWIQHIPRAGPPGLLGPQADILTIESILIDDGFFTWLNVQEYVFLMAGYPGIKPVLKCALDLSVLYEDYLSLYQQSKKETR